jgi:hypothetical protein
VAVPSAAERTAAAAWEMKARPSRCCEAETPDKELDTEGGREDWNDCPRAASARAPGLL